MEKQDERIFEPFVTIEHIMNFDPDKPETATPSRFIDAVLRALADVGAASAPALARRLGLSQSLVNSGVLIACGMTTTTLRGVFAIKTAALLHAEGRTPRLEDIAERLGFRDRSSVWAVVNNRKHAALARRYCPFLLNQRRSSPRLTSEEWRRILGKI